ncbi:methylisocitrate lyase [Paenibacillus sp. GCM10023252]|uniref:methylisocitrate lyase n=1 Tax=Paenibacillus sp. GCM10023252 TaxID=3252649 RepID=UPI003620B4D2
MSEPSSSSSSSAGSSSIPSPIQDSSSGSGSGSRSSSISSSSSSSIPGLSPSSASAGLRLRQALELERPLQIAGAVNAYSALLAERAGYRALYLSGAGIANASFGLPDLGMTTMSEVLDDVRRITAVTELPLLVDADTGFGHAWQIARCIQEMERAGAAAVHIEDQVAAKRCGHRPNKAVVSREEMADRIRAAVDARRDEAFVVMARTDAVAAEGINAAIERAIAYVQAGADMIFAEALTSLDQYRRFADEVRVPILANMTEFGRTPLYTITQLEQAGVSIALYPLSAFRAMSAAAAWVYETIRKDGTQQAALPHMQTRAELYEVLKYESYEQRLDQLFADNEQRGKDNGH